MRTTPPVTQLWPDHGGIYAGIAVRCIPLQRSNEG